LIKEGKGLEEVKNTCGIGFNCGACVKTAEEEINKMTSYNRYVGMKLDDVLKNFSAKDNIRVVDVNGIITADFVVDRINVVVDNGIVKRIFEG
jgi:hypothetical protein